MLSLPELFSCTPRLALMLPMSKEIYTTAMIFTKCGSNIPSTNSLVSMAFCWFHFAFSVITVRFITV